MSSILCLDFLKDTYNVCEVEILQCSAHSQICIENEKFFELKSKEYRDGIKRKETR